MYLFIYLLWFALTQKFAVKLTEKRENTRIGKIPI